MKQRLAARWACRASLASIYPSVQWASHPHHHSIEGARGASLGGSWGHVWALRGLHILGTLRPQSPARGKLTENP